MTSDLRRLLATAMFVTIAGCATSQLPASEDSRSTATGWKMKFGESGSNPVIVDGMLYVGSADGAVYALEPTTDGLPLRSGPGVRKSKVGDQPA